MKIEDLNLSALKYFLDAVELKSMTLSSEKNHVSRPAISQAIRRLEQWCGYDLLAHDKRIFEVTEEGKSFYLSAKQNFETLKKGFSQKSDLQKGLQIGCSESLIDLVFPALLPQLNKAQSPIIKTGPTQQLFSLLDKEEIHLAFMISEDKPRQYHFVEVYKGEFEIRSKSGAMEDLLITTETRPEVESFMKYTNKKKLKFKNQIVVESWTNSSRLAEIIGGACLVPNHMAKNKLSAVVTKGWKHSYTVYAVYRKKATLTQLETELLTRLPEKIN